MKIRTWNFQARQHPKGWFDFVLPFQVDPGGSNRRKALQLPHLCLNQPLPNRPRVETAVAEDDVHSVPGFVVRFHNFVLTQSLSVYILCHEGAVVLEFSRSRQMTAHAATGPRRACHRSG